MWLTAPSLLALHGFSLRQSQAIAGSTDVAFAGLNLSSRVGDEPSRVRHNRQQALAALGLQDRPVALLQQIHSATVVTANPDQTPQADAHVSTDPDTVLVIETADCYPILLEDTHAGVIGAAHAGWRGTVAGIATQTVAAMQALGADPTRMQAAIGPGICAARFGVGPEVVAAFQEAGFPPRVFAHKASQETESVGGSQWRIDLAEANRCLLSQAGIPQTSIWNAQACSFEERFFSYRRDAGKTGRMWAVIAQRKQKGTTP